jgi:hypothetical protein
MDLCHRTCWGILPRPPFSRFARRAVVGRVPSLLCMFLFGQLEPSYLTGRAPSSISMSFGCRQTRSDDLLPSSDQALPVTARRAKRENGGLGEDPPGSTLIYIQVRI